MIIPERITSFFLKTVNYSKNISYSTNTSLKWSKFRNHLKEPYFVFKLRSVSVRRCCNIFSIFQQHPIIFQTIFCHWTFMSWNHCTHFLHQTRTISVFDRSSAMSKRKGSSRVGVFIWSGRLSNPNPRTLRGTSSGSKKNARRNAWPYPGSYFSLKTFVETSEYISRVVVKQIKVS